MPMGRPPKFRPDDGDPPELAPEPLEPEEVAAEAIAHPFRSLSPETVGVLNQLWRENIQNDDDESKRFTRQIVGRLRRASHPEIHPGCTRVTIDVPMLPNKQYVRINEKAYYGTLEVWECEARTILELVTHSRRVELARLSDRGGGDIDLDSPLAERVRAIQRA
jgi:hypothetical protein